MLFKPQYFPEAQRIQGAFVSDEEIEKIADFLSRQSGSQKNIINITGRFKSKKLIEGDANNRLKDKILN